MKKIILAALTLLLIQHTAKAQGKNGQAQDDVKKVLVNLFDGVDASDISIIKMNCTSDFLMLQDSKVLDIALLTSKLKKSVSKISTTNTLNFMKVNFKGQNAWVNYRNTMHIVAADGQRYDVSCEESAVLVKLKDRWLVSELYSKTQKKS